MTPKQVEKLRIKISNIKRILAAEKRKFGCYDDSRGLRYLPAKYFIQLLDYKGGMTYLKWFNNNFPDDGGSPDFLFEWTIILFKCGNTREAEKKAFETFCANTYLFDKFFGRPITPVDKWEGSNLAMVDFTQYFGYSSKQTDLSDFSQWLDRVTSSVDFRSRCNRYIDIYQKLKTENDSETRHYLMMQARQLEETF